MNLYKSQSSTNLSFNEGTASFNFRIYFRLLTANVRPPPQKPTGSARTNTLKHTKPTRACRHNNNPT